MRFSEGPGHGGGPRGYSSRCAAAPCGGRRKCSTLQCTPLEQVRPLSPSLPECMFLVGGRPPPRGIPDTCPLASRCGQLELSRSAPAKRSESSERVKDAFACIAPLAGGIPAIRRPRLREAAACESGQPRRFIPEPHLSGVSALQVGFPAICLVSCGCSYRGRPSPAFCIAPGPLRPCHGRDTFGLPCNARRVDGASRAGGVAGRAFRGNGSPDR